MFVILKRYMQVPKSYTPPPGHQNGFGPPSLENNLNLPLPFTETIKCKWSNVNKLRGGPGSTFFTLFVRQFSRQFQLQNVHQKKIANLVSTYIHIKLFKCYYYIKLKHVPLSYSIAPNVPIDLKENILNAIFNFDYRFAALHSGNWHRLRSLLSQVKSGQDKRVSPKYRRMPPASTSASQTNQHRYAL